MGFKWTALWLITVLCLFILYGTGRSQHGTNNSRIVLSNPDATFQALNSHPCLCSSPLTQWTWPVWSALFIDLFKAFDTVDHVILKQSLISIGLSEQTVCWFDNQCVQAEGITSSSLSKFKGVPQRSVLGPLLFIIYINSLDQNVNKANFHFYANDTVIYCSVSTTNHDLGHLQLDIDTVQHTLCD